MLKLRTHEAIPLTRVFKEHEMYLEHGHVEDDRNENETEGAGIKMFDPELRRDTQVSKERPQLPNGLKADSGDGE